MSRDALQEALGRNEKAMAQVLGELAALDERMARQRRRLASLRGKIQEKQATLEGERRWLEEQLRKAYVLGRRGFLKVLLQAEDASALGRHLTYYRYWIKGRSDRIQAMREEIKALERLQDTLRKEQAGLLALGEKQQQMLASLRSRKEKHQRLLARLEDEVQSKEQVLARLKADERRLAALINRLQTTGRPVSTPAGLRKGLSWPLQGQFAARYGQPRRGGLSWQGVLILAQEGQPVHAIADGKVVFAGWLRGYGMLMIVDHGEGFMSLYGHNQRLIKKVGDWVKAEEVIAYVGKSGGRNRSGLYFEIRKQGKPQDPAVWCGSEG